MAISEPTGLRAVSAVTDGLPWTVLLVRRGGGCCPWLAGAATAGGFEEPLEQVLTVVEGGQQQHAATSVEVVDVLEPHGGHGGMR